MATTKCKATSFADPGDLRAFKRCKDRGGTDLECFKIGDNGIGYWGDSTAEGTGPCCAITPDDMIEKWGSINAAKGKLVKVTYKNLTVTCDCRDRMKWKKRISNGAYIDLNSDACKALKLKLPVFASVSWEWLA